MSLRLAGASVLLCGLVFAGPEPASAQVLLSQDEALESAYPDAGRLERRTAFLSDEQAAAVGQMIDTELDRRVITYYVAVSEEGRAQGVAYFDAHRVRTLREVLMVALDRDGAVARIEVLSFAEPREYMAPQGWLDLFGGRSLTGMPALRREIPNITGATLTSEVTKDAVARTLALHAIIAPLGDDAP